MPNADVTFLHPNYKAHYDQVKFVRTIYDGIDSARTLILKKPNEFDEDFNNRVSNSTLENFIERTVSTMSGEIMRKPLTYDGFTESEVEIYKVANKHKSLSQLTKDLIANGIRDGKAHILVDMPTDGGDAYFSIIERQQVTNWKKDENGIYTMVVIMETYLEEEGRFEVKYKTQYRVIDELGNVEIWRKSGDNGVWEIYDEITTSYNFCPFFELSLGDVPPLYDIATINASHLNRSSQVDDYLTEGLDPQLAFFGCGVGGDDDVSGIGEKTDTPKVVLGIRSAIFVDDTEAKIEWLEMSGANYEIAEKDLASKSSAMADRALRLRNESANNESATSAIIDNTEKQSRQTDIAEDAETAINDAIKAKALMMNIKEPTGTVVVNRDFNTISMDSGLIGGLNALQVSGNISKETLLKALQKAEVVDIDDIKQELLRIEEEVIPMETIE